MKKILIALLFVSNNLIGQNVALVGRLQIALPTAEAIDGIGGQIGLRFSTEYSTRKLFGFEVVLDNRRYSTATSNTKVTINAKNIQLGFPFSFGDNFQVSIMPCISIRIATSATVEQGNIKVKMPDSALKSSSESENDKSFIIGISKKISPRLSISCSGQYVFAVSQKSIFQIGAFYTL